MTQEEEEAKNEQIPKIICQTAIGEEQKNQEHYYQNERHIANANPRTELQYTLRWALWNSNPIRSINPQCGKEWGKKTQIEKSLQQLFGITYLQFSHRVKWTTTGVIAQRERQSFDDIVGQAKSMQAGKWPQIFGHKFRNATISNDQLTQIGRILTIGKKVEPIQTGKIISIQKHVGRNLNKAGIGAVRGQATLDVQAATFGWAEKFTSHRLDMDHNQAYNNRTPKMVQLKKFAHHCSLWNNCRSTSQHLGASIWHRKVGMFKSDRHAAASLSAKLEKEAPIDSRL
ncbi:hypothetical protein Tsp_05653 [Trichinella spiralis]|uniref:hypothetical protein n=1 Tax=Trichinella spiralis TaxID=6334 RepID=UPI0001EFE527|nr:hypothetical protein Tsp_05653 [Trichinella spiralis]